MEIVTHYIVVEVDICRGDMPAALQEVKDEVLSNLESVGYAASIVADWPQVQEG